MIKSERKKNESPVLEYVNFERGRGAKKAEISWRHSTESRLQAWDSRTSRLRYIKITKRTQMKLLHKCLHIRIVIGNLRFWKSPKRTQTNPNFGRRRFLRTATMPVGHWGQRAGRPRHGGAFLAVGIALVEKLAGARRGWGCLGFSPIAPLDAALDAALGCAARKPPPQTAGYARRVLKFRCLRRVRRSSRRGPQSDASCLAGGG